MKACRTTGLVVVVGLTTAGLVLSTVLGSLALLIVSLAAAVGLALILLRAGLRARRGPDRRTVVQGPPQPEPAPAVPPPSCVPRRLRADPATMSDEELCWVWRASFGAVQRAHRADDLQQWSKVRGAYLDEMQRRHAAGFTCWLAAGARAGSNPARYLCGRAKAPKDAHVVPDFPD